MSGYSVCHNPPANALRINFWQLSYSPPRAFYRAVPVDANCVTAGCSYVSWDARRLHAFLEGELRAHDVTGDAWLLSLVGRRVPNLRKLNPALLRASIAANESDLVAYTHEHDTGSKDRPGREFSVVRGVASAEEMVQQLRREEREDLARARQRHVAPVDRRREALGVDCCEAREQYRLHVDDTQAFPPASQCDACKGGADGDGDRIPCQRNE